MGTLRAAIAAACAAVLLAGCGSSATAGSPAASQNANNIRVCDHYRTQRAYVQSLAEPTLADAIKVATWVAADAAEATPGTPVARDLNAMSSDQRHFKSTWTISAHVRKDCTALGVKFQP